MNNEAYFRQFRKHIIGQKQNYRTAYGRQRLLYADWIAGGRLYRPIEDLLVNSIGPYVANTHTETSETGRLMTQAYQEAQGRIKKLVNAGSEDVILTTGLGIQVHGGCVCAGTYGHFLLNVSHEKSKEITDKINRGDLSEKPGWVRISLHPTMKDVENIAVTKGTYVLRYGPSLGGIIDVNTFHPETEKGYIHVKALTAYESNWDGNRQYLNINGGKKSFHYFLSGGYKNYCNYTDGKGDVVNSSFLKYNFSAGLGINPLKNHHVRLTWRESHGRDVRYPALSMDERVDDTRLLSLDYSIKKLASFIPEFDLKLYQSTVYHEMDNHKRTNYPTTDAVAKVDAMNTGFRAEGKILSGRDYIYAGFDFEKINKDGTRVMVMTMSMPPAPPATVTKKTNLWYDAVITNLGIFGEYHRPWRQFEFTASLRLDQNRGDSEDTLVIVKEGVSYFDETAAEHSCVSASAGLNWDLNKRSSLLFSLGRGQRSPNMTERYIKFLTVGYDNYDYLGDPLLDPETNYQADVTYKLKLSWGSLILNGFGSYVTDYITGKKLPPSVATPKTQGALGVKQFYNADYAVFLGGEAGIKTLESKPLSFNLSMAYTYAFISEATRYIQENGQITGEEVITHDPLPEMPPFEANLSADYKMLKDKLRFHLLWRQVASQNLSSVAMDEPTSPGFGLCNASVSYRPVHYLILTIGVNNAFDKAYYEHLNRKIIGTTEKLYEPGRSFFFQAYFDL